MIALNQKDLHVHSPFCPHRASDAPLEEYLTAAEKQGIVELGFAEHGPISGAAIPDAVYQASDAYG